MKRIAFYEPEAKMWTLEKGRKDAKEQKLKENVLLGNVNLDFDTRNAMKSTFLEA